MMVYLLGVYHNFQTEPCAEFSEYIRNFCIQNSIGSIAEEMNRDGLNSLDISSTVSVVAHELGSPHRYCDPCAEERKAKDILGVNDVDFIIWRDELSDDEADELHRIHKNKREICWIEKLQTIYVDPMLFVCGIAHLSTFSKLLNKAGFEAQILDKRWMPNRSNYS
ncbi:MAG: hypothetical protein WC701_14440 [Kiritimatiellales bacterium]|jgi:hypothetical protein